MLEIRLECMQQTELPLKCLIISVADCLAELSFEALWSTAKEKATPESDLRSVTARFHRREWSVQTTGINKFSVVIYF